MMVATPLASGANTTFLPSTTTQPSPPQSYTPGSRAMPQTPPSADVSPTNLYPHLHVRQLRPPKQPLYTPACLRPTEPLTKPKDIPDRPRAPDTPPQSKESSFDSGASHPVKGSTDRVPIVTPPIVGGADSSERDLGAAESRALDQDVGYVTGYPTIAHWKPDSSSSVCAICKTTFTWFFRRHHCRRCGDLVCGAHLAKAVPLDHNARLHPQGTASKACDSCYHEWTSIKRLRNSRTSSPADSRTSSEATLQPPLPIPQTAKQASGAHVGSMARSEGMVWSTF